MTSGSDPLAFIKLMPGFDFMRQFAQTAADKAATPDLTGWVTPSGGIQELDKRIADLKAVQSWLEQNVHVLRATVQALEIQKMTLAVLQNMNLSQADIAKAFAAPAPSAGQAASKPAAETASGPVAGKAAKPDPAQPVPPAAKPAPAPAAIDPLPWWEALTQQFQTIAATLRETTPPPAPAAPADTAPAAKPVRKAAAKPAAKRTAPKKSAPPAVRGDAA